MNKVISIADRKFKADVEACIFPVPDFDHRAHIALAYIYLAEHTPNQSIALMRKALIGLLKHAGLEPSAKYHETLTEAWILAVHHFMQNTPSSSSADHFIDQNPLMLDSKIMMTHYSAEVLFSDQARRIFVEPNLDPIPRYGT